MSKISDLMEATKGMSLFVRRKAAKLMDEQGLTVEQAAAVADELMGMFQRGKESGEREALYDSAEHGFPGGSVTRVHRVRDLRIAEYVPNGEQGVHYTPLSEGVPGYDHTTFDAALLDAIAMKHDGDMSQAGRLMARMLGLAQNER